MHKNASGQDTVKAITRIAFTHACHAFTGYRYFLRLSALIMAL